MGTENVCFQAAHRPFGPEANNDPMLLIPVPSDSVKFRVGILKSPSRTERHQKQHDSCNDSLHGVPFLCPTALFQK